MNLEFILRILLFLSLLATIIAQGKIFLQSYANLILFNHFNFIRQFLLQFANLDTLTI